MHSLIALALAVLLGAIFGTIHPPFSFLAGLLALPLAYLLALRTQKVFYTGFGFGFGYFFIVMHWIYEPFQIEKDVFGLLAYPAWIAMAAGLALFWLPIFRGVKHGPLVVSATFITMEFLRGHIFTGFPWALVNYALVDTSLAQAASVFGSWGMSFLIGYALLGIAFGKGVWGRVLPMVTIGVLVAIGQFRGAPANFEFAEFKVSLVQANISQAEAFDYSRTDEFIRRQVALSDPQADLVIWPEGAIAYDVSNTNDLANTLSTSLSNTPLLIGSPYFDDGNFYNSAHLIGRGGQVVHRYDKIHLVPFGEYIPFGAHLLKMGILVDTVTRFSMQKGALHDWQAEELPPFNILICYEGIFPQYAQREGAFIALITNDSWFGNQGGPYQHLAAARFRAIESGKPVARVAKTGITAMIDANGALVNSLPLNTAGSILAPIGPRFDSTIYSKLSDWPLIFAVFMIFAWTWYRHRLVKT